MIKKITTPFSEQCIKDLNAGDMVLISGVVYTARDAAHKRMAQNLAMRKSLPIDLQGQVIYYLGPAPAKPGYVIGAAGPTTSHRMDSYTPELLELGLKGMIGKGTRSQLVVDKIVSNCAVYFAAIGGAAALLAKSIKTCEVIAYDDLGTEAIHKLMLKNFPAIVAIDCYGNNQYIKGPASYIAQNK